MSLYDDAVLVLKDYERQPALRDVYLDHLASHPDGVWKACGAGHITASALVIDPARERVLLTLHRKLGMWLQTGGHCEPGDATLADAAMREAREESGIPEGLEPLPGGPVTLDRHSIPAPCHWHFDVQYGVLAPPDAVAAISEESLDLRWFSYEEVPGVADESVVRLLAGIRARLGHRT
ncbi:NUDIX hydrolase [Streptomyces sp. GC420]|uniref:NUDIX hydrolase n=1 Tax=Streptomyces sp. GC420 TaxID=2697568 RepID=UPI00141507D3|nr:NUDIX hydrolase [Streptomyces sp. GC420]NBM20171.1 NUDIX domain-containing protein [Streptomyces sp. GC420]